jgi:hypothetical protein
MLILSFDPADKTLAVILLHYNEHWNEELADCNNLKEINEKLDCFTIIYADVVYVTNPKNKFHVRMMDLKNFIKKLNRDVVKPAISKYKDTIKVLVEQQNPSNPISVSISHCLVYQYSNYNSCLVGASLKNNIELDPNNTYGDFIAKYSTVYTANKKHSENNFLYYLKIFNKLNIVDKFKKKDDISDAFMQILGWLSHQ